MHLFDRFGIDKGLVSVIGSGGKTTLIRELAEELAEFGTVVVATSTKIYKPDYCQVIIEKDISEEKQITEIINSTGIACVGTSVITPEGEEKVASPITSFAKLKAMADYVLVEADGSKRLPLKAHASYEPVIPECSDKTILVVGLGGLGKTIDEAAHRSEIYAKLAGASVTDTVTEAMIADVINEENLADAVYITQISGCTGMQKARELSDMIWKPCILADARY